MRIADFEAAGLTELTAWLEQKSVDCLPKAALREILKNINISFRLEGIDRIQSTLICELKDSYVQQSQRYAAMGPEAYNLPVMEEADTMLAKDLLKKTFAVYAKMSQSKDGRFKGRPKPENFKYGIPLEDARYILPLATKTNICVAMSGDKLVDFFRLLYDGRYGEIFAELREKIVIYIPLRLIKLLPKDNDISLYEKTIQDYNYNNFSKLGQTSKVVLLNCFNNADLKAGLGALTSTLQGTPSQYLAEQGEAANIRAVVKRVLGYGHENIAEQARFTVGLMCSMVTYHQQIRHRLSQNLRESLSNLINDGERPVLLPKTVQKSVFSAECLKLITKYRTFRTYIAEKYGMAAAYSFLLNCDQIKLLISTNARMDAVMLAERLCLNAQWEIRELAMEKLRLLRGLSEVLYEKALPACVQGKCKEGKLTCGQQQKVLELLKNIL